MKKRIRHGLILIAVLLCCLTLGAYSLADAGNFSGGSDWGGGGSSWGGGSSSWDSGSDWSSSSGSTYDSGSYSGDGLSAVGCLGGNLFTIFIIVIVVITVLRYMRSGQQGQGGGQNYTAAQEEPGLPLETLKEKDPNFNEQALLEKVGNQYIQMQNAWQNKD